MTIEIKTSLCSKKYWEINFLPFVGFGRRDREYGFYVGWLIFLIVFSAVEPKRLPKR